MLFIVGVQGLRPKVYDINSQFAVTFYEIYFLMFDIFLSLPPIQPILAQVVRPLPQTLDQIPVFNSNSPELILNEGILLSTFSGENKENPNAHLNYLFSGRFDIFAHHVAKAPTPDDLRTLYLGIIVHNPNNTPVTLEVLQGSTYLSQPDAPFISLPPHVEATHQDIYAGPGSRVMGERLRGISSVNLPSKITFPPQSTQILLNLPIPVKALDPPLNGRSTYLQLHSNGTLYLASLAKFASQDNNGQERPPTLAEWQNILKTGTLVTPRDRPPTPLDAQGAIIYGRVAGVSQGSLWESRLTDRGSLNLTLPQPGKAIYYGISTLRGGRLGTNQIQSAPLLVRYADTAYESHGNYGVMYRLTLPLYNSSPNPQNVAIKLETPVKEDRLTNGLQFLDPLPSQVFFRGLVQVKYDNQTRYFHLVQQRGQRGQPLITLNLNPQEQKIVQVTVIYPPDATPPQVLTVETLDEP